jgi:methylenetetrahydrofolate reductase (NADPH)
MGTFVRTLRETLLDPARFACGVELVTTRGTLATKKAARIHAMANGLADLSCIDWLSITDNAGGNPMLDPVSLGQPLMKRGKDLVIHLACKDYNRNGLEARAWLLANEGFKNILALSGDYPLSGFQGRARPASDLDSVTLLTLLNAMNEGLVVAPPTEARPRPLRLPGTGFFLGAAVSNFKLHEREVMPQLFKLDRKIAAGAHFIISQIGYDSRKFHELIAWHRRRGHENIPLVGNVYLLNARVAAVFNQGKIPGVVVSNELQQECERRGKEADGGHSFFIELAAQQVAIFKGLGYRAAYLGNIEKVEEAREIWEKAQSYGADDWKQFARGIRYGRPKEFYFFAEDSKTGLADPDRVNPDYEASLRRRVKSKHVTMGYRFSRMMHAAAFTPDAKLFCLGRWLYSRAKDKEHGPWCLQPVERASKAAIFDCRHCGDCSLPDIAYLCPMSQCAKNMRNGPCGGGHEGLCEARDRECIWARAYERMKYYGEEQEMLKGAPVFQDNTLLETSSWANTFLGRDHFHFGSKKSAEAAPVVDAEPKLPAEPKKPKPKPAVTAGAEPNTAGQSEKAATAKREGKKAMAIPGLTIIAEAINDSVPSTAKLYNMNDIEGIKALAKRQAEGNSGYIDVNVGSRGPELLAQVVREVQSVTDKPLSIDTPDPKLAAAGLEAYDVDRARGHKPILNSLSMLRMSMLELYRIKPFRPILLATEGVDANGVSAPCKNVDDVHRAAQAMLKMIRASGANIPNEDLIIDPGIAPIGADMDGLTKRVLDSIARLKGDPEFAGCHFSVGLSNFSVMLPPKRANGKAVKTPLQNAFLTKAMPLGLDMIIGAADREYRILKPGDDALVCLDEFLALEDVEATLRVKEFYS